MKSFEWREIMTSAIGICLNSTQKFILYLTLTAQSVNIRPVGSLCLVPLTFMVRIIRR
jgi:hypothetical protein